jgi:K+-transporting ATPase ATPase A chain
VLGLTMLVGRFLLITPVLALGGRFAGERVHAASAGTLPTTSPVFVALLLGVVVLVGGLTYLPVLVTGPMSKLVAGWPSLAANSPICVDWS